MENSNLVSRSDNISKTKKIALYGILSAIIIIMSFTPLGYLKIGTALSITFLPIPVAIGAAILGPWGGLYFGALFGITSFIQCFGIDAMGTFLFNLSPVGTFVLCVVTRALMGFCCGLIFRLISRIDKTKIISFIVSSFSAAFLNTLFFLSALILLFSNYADRLAEQFGIDLSTILLTLVSVNGIIEIIVCTVIGFAVSKALAHFLIREKN